MTFQQKFQTIVNQDWLLTNLLLYLLQQQIISFMEVFEQLRLVFLLVVAYLTYREICKTMIPIEYSDDEDENIEPEDLQKDIQIGGEEENNNKQSVLHMEQEAHPIDISAAQIEGGEAIETDSIEIREGALQPLNFSHKNMNEENQQREDKFQKDNQEQLSKIQHLKKTKAIHKLERHSFKKNDFKNIGLESEENRPPIDMI